VKASDLLWHGYAAESKAESEQEARDNFIATYGREPEEVWFWGCYHSGPITEQEHKARGTTSC